MPSTKYFCAARNTMSIGNVYRTAPAIVNFHSTTLYSFFSDFNASANPDARAKLNAGF